MKKKLLVLLSFLSLLLVWCSSSNNQVTKIDPEKWFSEKWISVEEAFDKEMDQSQYIKDFEKIISYNVLLITGDKPFTSDFSFTAKFDENSSLQWWVDLLRKKISDSYNVEFSDVDFSIRADQQWEKVEPFDLSWNLSILYENGEVYANLHDLDVFMWEWNIVAKMYTLLWDLVIGNWVNLEVHSWWIVTIDESGDKKLPYLIWTIKNVLSTRDIQSGSNFLWSIVEVISVASSYIDLWISTDELTMSDYEISYFELPDKTIQKEFIWFFQWKDSSFDLSFIASKNWLEVHLYNIKKYNEDALSYEDVEREFMLLIKESGQSEYLVNFESLNSEQKVLDLQGEVKYGDIINFSGNFILEPLEIMIWQKISWKLYWSIEKKSWEWDKKIPELTGNVLLRSELLDAL